MFNYVYDFARQGLDTNLWKQVSGTASVTGNKLVVNADELVHYGDNLRGTFVFGIDVPAGPTTGDVREFGVKSLAKDVYAVFSIVDDVFSCKTKNAAGDTEEKVAVWDTAWETGEHVYSIDVSGQGVQFNVNGSTVAYIETVIPNVEMSLYLKNSNADDMKVGYAEAQGVETYL